ncbi:hypothetical protein GW17_00015950 [Ensete ventricosum]|nr:hypothetical protein GW17_00015950 [Ensete ventricosum]
MHASLTNHDNPSPFQSSNPKLAHLSSSFLVLSTTTLLKRVRQELCLMLCGAIIVSWMRSALWCLPFLSSSSRSPCLPGIGGSSGAVASGAALLGEMISTQKKTRGARDDGHGDGRPEEKRPEQGRKARARAKTGPAPANNNCTSPKDADKERRDGGVAAARDGNGSNIKGKRRRSPAVLAEGSRCSRVNGRGWRCCQQTLVGYSLCEHHLGKGRLRSVSSVRGHLGTSQPKWSFDGKTDVLSSTSPGEDENEEEEERKTMGMVKARSISSLLDDTNHSQPEVETTPSPSPPRGNESQSNGQCRRTKETQQQCVKSLRDKDSSQDSVFIQSDGRYLSRRRSVTHHRNRSEQQSRSSATATIAPFASYKPMAFPDASAAMRRCSVPKGRDTGCHTERTTVFPAQFLLVDHR